jgi:diaminopimelate epimerase
MCGNAIRCVGKYLFEKTGKTRLVIGTKSGEKQLKIEGETVVVDMGMPTFLKKGKKTDVILLGNRHAVVYGRKNIAKAKRLQKKYDVNVEFYTPKLIEVFERGSGETLSCGTGACAVAVSLIERGYKKRGEWIPIPMLGGTLEVMWEKEVYLRGKGVKVFEGSIVL